MHSPESIWNQDLDAVSSIRIVLRDETIPSIFPERPLLRWDISPKLPLMKERSWYFDFELIFWGICEYMKWHVIILVPSRAYPESHLTINASSRSQKRNNESRLWRVQFRASEMMWLTWGSWTKCIVRSFIFVWAEMVSSHCHVSKCCPMKAQVLPNGLDFRAGRPM